MSFPRLGTRAAAPAPQARLLFRSALVTVTEHRCAADAPPCTLAHTAAPSTCLVFTTVGAFRAHVPGGAATGVEMNGAEASRASARLLIADPLQALVLAAPESVRLAHAAGLGHTSLCIAFQRPTVLAAARAIAASLPRERTMLPVGALVAVSPALLLRYHRFRRRLERARRGPHTAPALSTPAIEPAAIEQDALALLHAVLLAAWAMPADRTHDRRREIADAARLALATMPRSAHRLTDLARTVGTSPSQLSHVFRAVVGVPVHQYLLHLRLAIALDRLAGADVHLSSLALDLGFATHSHFSAAFRRWFGTAPTAARAALGRRHAGGVPARRSASRVLVPALGHRPP